MTSYYYPLFDVSMIWNTKFPVSNQPHYCSYNNYSVEMRVFSGAEGICGGWVTPAMLQDTLQFHAQSLENQLRPWCLCPLEKRLICLPRSAHVHMSFSLFSYPMNTLRLLKLLSKPRRIYPHFMSGLLILLWCVIGTRSERVH